MNTCIQNFLDGNISLAKEQALVFNSKDLSMKLFMNFGMSHGNACATALYLKGKTSMNSYWQYKLSIH